MSAPTVVELRGVSKSYRSLASPVPVLADVDLRLAGRDKASLIGPSGSGKSTLLALIAGLLSPDAGTVAICGIDTASLGDAERAHVRSERIGIALQSDNLIPFLSARENIELAVTFAGRRDRRDRSRQLLERLGLADRADHRPRQLSGGEAQRVAIAVAMANEPSVLLADEVVAALDAETAGTVIDEVLDADCALLYVTHDITLADRVPLRFELRGQRIEVRP